MKWILGCLGALVSLGLAAFLIMFIADFPAADSGDTASTSQPAKAAPTAPPPSQDADDDAVASRSTSNAGTDKLQYDPETAIHHQREANVEFRSRECMSDYATVLLRGGLRDRKLVTDQLVRICGQVWSSILAEDGVKPDVADQTIRAAARQELDQVVNEGQ